MKSDKETRKKLLESARKEFLEKGFMQASLRNICKNAGVTTGALYFFFQDKEDLFANLVQEPLEKLRQVMSAHYMGEMEQPPEALSKPGDFGEDIEAAKEAVHFMYQYYEEFLLLLVKSQGSRFENCAEQFVEITEKHYRALADRICENTGAARVEDYMIHWLSHVQIDAFVHMLIHERSEEAACRYMESVVRYQIIGWLDLFRTGSDG